MYSNIGSICMGGGGGGGGICMLLLLVLSHLDSCMACMGIVAQDRVIYAASWPVKLTSFII